MFLYSNGSLINEGDVIKNIRLADTLEMFMKQDESFYKGGSLGNDLVEQLEDDNVMFKHSCLIL